MYNDNHRVKEIVKILNISYPVIYRVIKHYEDNDKKIIISSLIGKKGRKNKDITQSIKEKITSIIGNDNSLTLSGIQYELEKQNLSFSLMHVSRLVKKAGFTRKRIKRRPKIVLTPQHIQSIREYCIKLSQLSNHNIFYIDESGFDLFGSIHYGFAPKNQSPYLYGPNSKGKNISLCAIISNTGIRYHEIKNRPYNSDLFKSFLIKCKQSNIFTKKSLLIMDNVPIHKTASVLSYLKSSKIKVLFLPTYSPDLNPIEHLFHKIKSTLDKIRPRAETKANLIKNIVRTVNEMKDEELFNYYDNMWDIVYAKINNQ